MRTLTLETDPLAVTVEFSADAFCVALEDGRELSVPLAWFPRLVDQQPAALASTTRDRWRGQGIGAVQ